MSTAPRSSAAPKPRRRVRRAVALATLAAALVATLAFRKPLFQGNFGVVESRRVYRSAQPNAAVLALIRDGRFGSVLNLRGGDDDDPWYRDEVEATRASGADFYDLPMSATRRPTRAELTRLVDLFGSCRYPILIHCKSGSDRTGLASGLYLMTEKSVLPRDAEGSFTLRYGHVPLLGPEKLHEPFREYAAWLESHKTEHSAAAFRRWLATEYGPAGAETPSLRAGPRLSSVAKAQGPA